MLSDATTYLTPEIWCEQQNSPTYNQQIFVQGEDLVDTWDLMLDVSNRTQQTFAQGKMNAEKCE